MCDYCTDSVFVFVTEFFFNILINLILSFVQGLLWQL